MAPFLRLDISNQNIYRCVQGSEFRSTSVLLVLRRLIVMDSTDFFPERPSWDGEFRHIKMLKVEC